MWVVRSHEMLIGSVKFGFHQEHWPSLANADAGKGSIWSEKSTPFTIDAQSYFRWPQEEVDRNQYHGDDRNNISHKKVIETPKIYPENMLFYFFISLEIKNQGSILVGCFHIARKIAPYTSSQLLQSTWRSTGTGNNYSDCVGKCPEMWFIARIKIWHLPSLWTLQIMASSTGMAPTLPRNGTCPQSMTLLLHFLAAAMWSNRTGKNYSDGVGRYPKNVAPYTKFQQGSKNGMPIPHGPHHSHHPTPEPPMAWSQPTKRIWFGHSKLWRWA